MLLLIAGLMLSACSLLPQKPEVPGAVEIPVAVSCVKAMPEAPKVHTDAELLQMDDYDFVTALHIDRQALFAYQAKADAILKACQ
jgi:hypothetical protein